MSTPNDAHQSFNTEAPKLWASRKRQDRFWKVEGNRVMQKVRSGVRYERPALAA